MYYKVFYNKCLSSLPSSKSQIVSLAEAKHPGNTKNGISGRPLTGSRVRVGLWLVFRAMYGSRSGWGSHYLFGLARVVKRCPGLSFSI